MRVTGWDRVPGLYMEPTRARGAEGAGL
jgi:hypothetical protein